MFASWRARLTPSASTSASCHRLRAAALGAHSVYRRADLAPAWYSVNGNTSSRAAPPPAGNSADGGSSVYARSVKSQKSAFVEDVTPWEVQELPAATPLPMRAGTID